MLRAYRNIPYDSTGEKPSFLLFGVDCRSPTEAALVPPQDSQVTSDADISDYHEEPTLLLSTARDEACHAIRKAQKCYKAQHHKETHDKDVIGC